MSGDGHGGVQIVDATEAHLPGITAIFNHAVRETFSIWSETETTLELRKAWLATRERRRLSRRRCG